MTRKTAAAPAARKNMPQASVTAGGSAQGLVESLRLKTRALCEILDAETRALASSDLPGFFSVQEGKTQAAQSWHGAFVELADLKGRAPSPISADLKAQLEAVHRALSETVAHNRAALERSARSFQRLGDRIMTHTRRAALERSPVSYSAAGTMQAPAKRTLSMGLSESA